MRKLLIIDPQNDFCDIPEVELGTNRPALKVAGAHADMLRLAGFISAAGETLLGITVTLDSHPYVAIERTTFWVDADGKEVDPYIEITSASVVAGTYRPLHGNRIEPISQKPLTERVIELLTQLEAAGHYTLRAWPVHCVTGTWGANIHSAVERALETWERQAIAPVRKVHKGEYHLAEHYGVFEAETPLWEVESTRFNDKLAESLIGNPLSNNTIYVAGEASSHCVAASVEQLIRFRKGNGAGIVLLTDCMSPVTGYEEQVESFFERVRVAGVQLMTCAEALAMLKA
jgi:nicotinamidase/pyrazinamidase